MFKRLAKFRRLELRHLVPHWLEAAHSNDNPRGRRRPTGQRRSPQPVLACHWIVVDESRLECRRKAESFDETSVEESGGRQIRCPHASSFLAKAIGHPRTGFRSSYTTLLHRNSRRDPLRRFFRIALGRLLDQRICKDNYFKIQSGALPGFSRLYQQAGGCEKALTSRLWRSVGPPVLSN